MRPRLLALLLPLALVVPAAPAGAEPVPGAASYTVTGYGYGHGRGMSQYGAQGAAKQGLTWPEIVGFYYPGTTPAPARGRLKVLLTADKGDVQVDARSGLRLTRLADGKSFDLTALRSRATSWRIKDNGSRSVVSFRRGGGWQRWTSFAGPAEFAAGRQPVTLRLPGGAAAPYRGALRSAGGRTVNVVSLDQYVRGVVPREVPVSWPAEALRAQAVAARTYAAFERATATTSYDTCDTTSCQVYGGVAAETPQTDDAVRATKRQVLTWQGQPAFTQFSSSSGGFSAAGSQPYLVAQADPYEAGSDNPNDPWTTTLTRAQLEKAFPGVGTLQGVELTRDGVGGTYGGRVSAVVLKGSGGTVQVSGDDFRFRLGLKSTWLQLQPS